MSVYYRILLTPKPVPSKGTWLKDGDQDGDPWEGSLEAARKIVAASTPDRKWDYEIIPML